MTMDARKAARELLLRHSMHPELLELPAIVRDFRAEMLAGCRAKPSSLGMYPAYINTASAPAEGKVLVIDAGGTNLRLARLSYKDGTLSIEEMKKRSMPGTGGAVTADEFFLTLAEELLPLCEEVERACFCFSYPSEVLPDGDGLAVRLTKELCVEGLPGMRLCAPLEDELVRLGAPGHRRWRVINDTVSTQLCGMAQNTEPCDDHIGFILGTGFNMCANVDSALLLKAPAAAGLGSSCIVNFESGGFGRFPRGTADRELDAASDAPGAQLVEKCISGAYQAPLLRQTLLLAIREGLFSAEAAALIPSLSLTAAHVSALAEENAPCVFPALSSADYALLQELNRLLLERSAMLAAACLAAAVESRELPAGSRVCICADGTTFARNPLLRPRTDFWLSELLQPSGVRAFFYQVSDATLLGTAYAALLP